MSLKITIGLCFILGCALVMTAGADTHYVAHGGQTPSGTYTSWETAASNIQNAVNAAVSLDTILVSNGTYNAGGTGARVEFGTKGIALLAVSTNPYDTVIDGGGAICCVSSTGGGSGSFLAGFLITNGINGIYFSGNPASPWVVSNCVIDGCSYPGNSGGGVYSYYAKKLLLNRCEIRNCKSNLGAGGVYQCVLTNNCQVSNNNATNSNSLGGGLLYCTMYGGTLAGNQANGRGGGDRCYLYDVTVSSNMARGSDGGGLYSFEAYDCRFYGNSAPNAGGGGIRDVLASNCWFSGNYAWHGGAAFGSNTILLNCVISNNGVNGANGYGGGMCYGGLASNCLFTANTGYMGGAAAHGATLIDCVISNNTPRYCAGIVSTYSSYYRACNAIRCVIIGNTATFGYGGGAHDCNLTNCLIVKNKAANGAGGASYCNLVNCTIVSNETTTASIAGGVSSGYYLTNCIVWGNVGSGGAISNYGAGIVMAYSCTTPMPTGTVNGGGNTSADPKFMDIGGGNYRLAGNSPCIDAGTNQAWMAGDIDLDRGIRIDKLSGHVDMGAYEYTHRGVMFSFR